MTDTAITFVRLCYRHRTPFDRWRQTRRFAEEPICERCEREHGWTAPLWWITTEDGVKVGWAHLEYGGVLFGGPPELARLESLPLGLSCRLPSGEAVTIWSRRSSVNGEGTIEVIAPGRQMGHVRLLRGGLLVEPLPEVSPHKWGHRRRVVRRARRTAWKVPRELEAIGMGRTAVGGV